MNRLAIDANRGHLTTEWAVYYADGRTLHFLTRLEDRDRGAALTFVYERIPVEHHARIAVLRWEGPETAA